MASIADVYVTVLPETGKIASGIEKALRDVDVKAIAETWKAKIEQVLKGTEVDVQIKVDGAKAKAEIEKTAKDQKATIEVDTDGVAAAEAKIDVAARDRKSKIKVDVDKGGMGITELAALSQVLTQGVAQGANVAGTAVGGASNAVKGLSQSASGGATTMMAYGAAIAALTPVLFAVAGAAAAAAGAVALLPAAFAAAGVGAGVLMVGLSGITDAYTAVAGAAKSAGKDAQEHASKVQSASRSVTSAQQSLTSAVRSEKSAQNDLARARKDALHELQDINDELRNGAIDETQANLDLAKARQELATGTFDSSLDYQQAQLNVIKAEQRAKQAHEDNAQVQQDANEKQQKGVEGADAVVAAQQRLADAQQQTANAQTALADAQQQLVTANNDVSTSAQKAADALGLLSPAGQDFVNTLVGLTPIWNQFKQDLQQPLLTGLGDTLTNSVNAILPAVMPGLTRVASAFNEMFKGAGDWLQKPENLAMISHIIDNIASAFEQLKPAVQPFLTAMGTLTSAGSDFLPGLAHAISDAVTQFSNFITEAQKSGELKEFIMKAVFAFQELGKLMPTILWAFGRFSDMGVAALPGLVDAINLVVGAIGFIAPAFVAPFDALHKFKQFIENIPGWWNKAWSAAANFLSGVWDTMKEWFSKILEGINWVIRGLNYLPLVNIPEIDVPTWYSGGGGSVDANAGGGLPVAAPGQNNRVQPRTDRPSNAPGAPPAGPTPALPPGSPAPGTPGGPPAGPVPTSGAADGTRVFVTNWPAGGVGGGGGAVTTTSAPGVSPVTTSGAVPVIPDPAHPGKFTSSNPEWAKLIARESAGSPTVPQGDIGDVNNATGDLAMGLFQITGATWKSHGGEEFAPSADKATPEQQGIVAGRIFAERGGQPWGATPGGGRENEDALRAGLAPGTSPTAPSPAAPQGPSPSSPPGTQPTTAVPGEQVGTTAGRLAINAAAGLNEGSGWRTPDGFDEHSGGNAVDFMVGTDKAKGDRVLALALQNPNVDYALWQQRQWNSDGTSSPMDDRHNPTANHMDHVHVHFKSTGYAAGNEPSATGKARGSNAAPAPSTPASLSPNAGITGTPGVPGDVGPISLDPNVPLDQQGNKDKGKGYGQQLGQDIISGMMEVFGLGDVFPDPTQFGLFKIFKSLLAVKPGGGGANGGPTNATNGSGTGDPFMDLLGSLVPNANGTGGILGAWAPPGSPASGQGAGAPPGPVDNSFNVTVQGDAGPKAVDAMDTQHISTIRNTAPGG